MPTENQELEHRRRRARAMKRLFLSLIAASVFSASGAVADEQPHRSTTSPSITSPGTGGTTGAGASGLNTSAENNGGGGSAPAKSAPVAPGHNGDSADQHQPAAASPNEARK